jgi:hypothetical protein
MGLLVRMGLVLGLGLATATAQWPAALAWNNPSASAVQAQALVPFSSKEGLARLTRSNAVVNFPTLANQFEPQSNPFFCGPTSAAIVLNALYQGRRTPTLARFTPDNVITKGRKTRAQVLGEPVWLNGKQMPDFGYQIRQLDEMLRAHGAITTLRIVDDNRLEPDIRRELVENLQHRGHYVLVAYQRDAIGQRGGGHLSPLGAYDEVSDSFLVLDVNPENAAWVWIPTATLIRGMRTFDTLENRGYVLIQLP